MINGNIGLSFRETLPLISISLWKSSQAEECIIPRNQNVQKDIIIPQKGAFTSSGKRWVRKALFDGACKKKKLQKGGGAFFRAGSQQIFLFYDPQLHLLPAIFL